MRKKHENERTNIALENSENGIRFHLQLGIRKDSQHKDRYEF